MIQHSYIGKIVYVYCMVTLEVFFASSYKLFNFIGEGGGNNCFRQRFTSES